MFLNSIDSEIFVQGGMILKKIKFIQKFNDHSAENKHDLTADTLHVIISKSEHS